MRRVDWVCAAFTLALAACNGGSGARDGLSLDSRGADLGAATGPLKCPGYTTPSFSKACAAAGECAVAMHQTDCCGSTRAIGIRAGDKTLFDSEEKKCSATYPGCGCASGPPTTEDGSRVVTGGIGVDCLAGRCTTFAQQCGKVCPGGLSCRTCAVKTTVYAACSRDCASDQECSDPALPRCEGDGFGGKFCTVGGIACGQ